MALALTILAIALACLALGVQLADLRLARGGRVRLPSGSAAGNDNAPAATSDGITLVRPKIADPRIARPSLTRPGVAQ